MLSMNGSYGYSIVSSSTPTQTAIEPCLDKDGPAHAFMLFKTKPQVPCQFLGKDNKTAKNYGMYSNKGIIETIRLKQ